MSSKRIISIDLLRGLAVVLMTTLHIGSYYHLDKPTTFSWDYLRFIVPLFVFCSAYMEFVKPARSLTIKLIASRLKRLLIPYWIFVVVGFCVNAAMGHGFNPVDFLRHALLLRVDTIDFDWLVSLFVAFAFIIPLIHSYRTDRFVYTFFLVLSFSSAVLLLFFKTPLPFRLMMWIPWLWIVFEVDFFLRFRSKKWIVPIMLGLSLFLFLISRELLIIQHKSIQLFSNKYPPNLYYLSYGSLWMLGFFTFFERFGERLPKICIRFLTFLSGHSFSFYLIHIFFLFAMNRVRVMYGVPVYISILFVVIGTSCTQLVLNYVSNFSKLITTSSQH